MATFYTNISAKAYADALSVGLFGAAASQNVENAAAVAMGIPPSQLASTVPTNLQIWNAGTVLAQSPLFEAQYPGTAVDAAFFTALNTALTGSTFLMASQLAAFQAVASQYSLNQAQAATYYISVILSVDPSSLGLSTTANPGNPGGLSDAQTYLNQANAATNRTLVSSNFATQSASASNLNYPVVGPTTNAGFIGAENSVIGVSNLTSTVVVAEAQIGAAAAANNPALISGQTPSTTTYDLTVNVDTYVATSPNNVFNGQIIDANAAGSTFQAFDTLTGFGSGNATQRNCYSTAAGAFNLAPANVSGIQTVNLRNVQTVAGDDMTSDASTLVGATTVNSYLSSNKVIVTNLATGAAAGIIGNGTGTTGDFDFGYATGSANATLNVSGGTTGTPGVAVTSAATNLTINSTGAANKLGAITITSGGTNRVTAATINASTNLTVSSLSDDFTTTGTLTISGAAPNVTLGTLPATTLGTVNASGLTNGGVTATIGNLAVKFTGGAGVDTITTNGVLTGSVDAGGGVADKLIVAAAADVAATPAALYSNFEILNNNSNDNLDAALFTKSNFTAIQLGGNGGVAGGGVTNMTVAQAANVTNQQDTDTLTLSLATSTGSTDVLNVTLLNATSVATSADLTALTANGFETINVTSSSGAAGDISALSFAAATSLSSLKLTGAYPISVTTTNITTVGGTNIDASGITFAGTSSGYAFTVTGNLVSGSVVTGSATADSITTTAAITGTTGNFVTYQAGAGDDAISSTIAAINNTSAGDGSVKIGGSLGTDTLTLTDAGGLTTVDANFQYLTGIETIKYNVANKAISFATGGFFDTNFNGNTLTTLNFGDATNAAANTVNISTFTGNADITLTATAATANSQAVTGGTGNDTITVLVEGLTTGSLAVNAGSGNDKITVTSSTGTLISGTLTLTGGTGVDTFTIKSGPTTTDQDNVSFVFNLGDSSTTSFDSITGFALADNTTSSYVLNFAGSAVAAANAAAQNVTGYTAQELTYTIANGLLSFAGTSAAGLTVAQKVGIAQTYVTTDLNSVVFTQTNADATVDSYVFNNNTGGDTVVQLVGVTGLGLGALAVTTGYVTVA